jgi:hypothetical protein
MPTPKLKQVFKKGQEMLKKELDIVKLLKRVRKTRILVDQRIKDPKERIKIYSSKKMVIGLESDTEEEINYSKKPTLRNAPSIGLLGDNLSPTKANPKNMYRSKS